MPYYVVSWEHDITITYETIVEAESEKEALEKAYEGEYKDQQEIAHQGLEIRMGPVEKISEEE